MSARCSLTSSRIRKKSSARRESETSRQVRNASFATWTAASTSSTVAKSTAPDCSPVAGFQTGPLRPDVPGTLLPPTQWWIGFAVGGAIVSVIVLSSSNCHGERSA